MYQYKVRTNLQSSRAYNEDLVWFNFGIEMFVLPHLLARFEFSHRVVEFLE